MGHNRLRTMVRKFNAFMEDSRRKAKREGLADPADAMGGCKDPGTDIDVDVDIFGDGIDADSDDKKRGDPIW